MSKINKRKTSNSEYYNGGLFDPETQKTAGWVTNYAKNSERAKKEVEQIKKNIELEKKIKQKKAKTFHLNSDNKIRIEQMVREQNTNGIIKYISNLRSSDYEEVLKKGYEKAKQEIKYGTTREYPICLSDDEENEEIKIEENQETKFIAVNTKRIQYYYYNNIWIKIFEDLGKKNWTQKFLSVCQENDFIPWSKIHQEADEIINFILSLGTEDKEKKAKALFHVLLFIGKGGGKQVHDANFIWAKLCLEGEIELNIKQTSEEQINGVYESKKYAYSASYSDKKLAEDIISFLHTYYSQNYKETNYLMERFKIKPLPLPEHGQKYIPNAKQHRLSCYNF